MIVIGDLRAKGYAERDIPPHGPSMVVPAKEFQEEWRGKFAKQGQECIDAEVGNEKVVLVKLSINPDLLKQANTLKRPGKPAWLKGPDWKPEDEERLLKRMRELTGPLAERARQLTPEFKGRSTQAIVQKYKKLLRAEEKKKGKTATCGKESLTKEPAESFEAMWKRASGFGTDIKQRAEVFYYEAMTTGLPAPLIKSVVSLCCGMDLLRQVIEDIEADTSKVDAVLEKLQKHKHAPMSGETMLPMEASET